MTLKAEATICFWLVLFCFWTHRLSLAASIEILCCFDVWNSQMTSTTNIDTCGITISHNIFCPSYFCFVIISFATGKWQTIKPTNPNHITLLLAWIILFLFFNMFWWIIVFSLLGYLTQAIVLYYKHVFV